MNHRSTLRFLLCFLFLTTSVCAQKETVEDTQFSIYGFGRTTFVWDNQDMGRSDLFVPANIKVGAKQEPNFFIGSKQSRIGMDIKHAVGGESLKIKLEGDFHNDATDATGLFRMRHAYAEYRFVMVGMTWSNFFDEDVNPVTVDFEGPNSSTLSRTPQLRFSTYKTKNVWSLSFENPLEKVTLGDSMQALPERFPDVIGAYRLNGNFGFVKLAALFREIRYESDKTRSLLGYGLTVMTSVKVGEKDKLKFQGVAGTGVSKYIQGAASLNYDAVYNGTMELEELQMTGFNLSYQHYWKDHVHSSLTGGVLLVEDNKNLKSNDYQSGYYGAVNIFWDVIRNLTFGAEALVGERANVNGASETAMRFQMNATYKFNKTFK